MRLIKDERGIISAFFAIMMLVFMALAGIIIDGGILMLKKIELTSASEAAILSVAKAYNKEIWEKENRVEINPLQAEEYVQKLLSDNMKDAKLVDFGTDPLKKDTAWIKTKVKCEFVFMKIFGVNEKTLYVEYDVTVGG